MIGTTAVIGCGIVGTTIGAAIAARGHQVVAVDVDPQRVSRLQQGTPPFEEPGLAAVIDQALHAQRLEFTSDVARVSEADTVVVTVGTPVTATGSANLTQLSQAADAVAEHVAPGALVVLKSTVPPGATEDIMGKAIERRHLTPSPLLAFCPERLAEGRALKDITQTPVVVGGVSQQATDRAETFWREALGVTTIPVASAVEAELVKLADNWWIDLNIAMANELARVSQTVGADVREVIHAANSLPKGGGYVNILSPGIGVGGTCLVKDPLMVATSARDQGVHLRLPHTARMVNDEMPRHTASRIMANLAPAPDRAPEPARVAVLGVAFKNNSGDTRHSPALEVVRHLQEAGAQVTVFDPLVDPTNPDLSGLTLQTELPAAVAGAHCVAVLAVHDEFRQLDLASLGVAPGCLFYDGRNSLDQDEVESLSRGGLRYMGVGVNG